MRRIVSTLADKFGGRPLVGAEVGVEKGDNARNLLNHLNMSRLFLIDIWRPFVQNGKTVWTDEICAENYGLVVASFANSQNVTIVRKSSVEAAMNTPDWSLDFVYIDASHQYDSVLQDCTVWFNKVRNGGIMAGHDYCMSWPGVILAVTKFSIDYRLQVMHGGDPDENADDWWIVV